MGNHAAAGAGRWIRRALASLGILAGPRPTIHLIATVAAERAAWIPQFIEHYRGLGVETFHLSLQFQPETPRREIAQSTRRCERLLAKSGIALASVMIWPADSVSRRSHHDLVQLGIPHSDWIVWTEVDELQVYPRELTSLIDEAERLNLNAFGGVCVDHLAEGGWLASFDPSRTLWEQFPVHADVTARIFGGCAYKVTCAKASVRLRLGNYDPLDAGAARYYASPVRIHCFYWDNQVTERLRLAQESSGPERLECERKLTHIARHPGRIELQQSACARGA